MNEILSMFNWFMEESKNEKIIYYNDLKSYTPEMIVWLKDF